MKTAKAVMMTAQINREIRLEPAPIKGLMYWVTGGDQAEAGGGQGGHFSDDGFRKTFACH